MKPSCSVAHCTYPHAARGWCLSHWRRWRKYGDPAGGHVRAPGIPISIWFWTQVAKSEGCWLWTGTLDYHGYGRFKLQGKMQLAHRYAWTLKHGPVPDGMCVLHHCDNPPCNRPDHMFLGTQLDNIADRVAKERNRRGPGNTVGRPGETNPFSKLTNTQVLEIRRRYAAGETQTALAPEFGIAQAHVSQIVLRQRWAHI